MAQQPRRRVDEIIEQLRANSDYIEATDAGNLEINWHGDEISFKKGDSWRVKLRRLPKAG